MFADSLNGATFDGQPLPYATTYTSMLYIGDLNGNQCYVSSKTNGAIIYAFFVGNNLRFVSKTSGVYGYLVRRGNTSTDRIISTPIDNSDWYYDGTNGGFAPTSVGSVLPSYNTLEDAILDLDNYISPTSPARSSYSLENGWLSVIDLGSSGTAYDLDLSTTFQMNSGLISGTWGDGTTQRYWFSNTLPDVNSQYVNDGSLIVWQKGTPQNVFGQTRNAVVNLSGNSTGRYLYILNPAFQRIADEDGGSITNNPVQISGLLSGQTAYIYELTASATLSGVVNKISTVSVDGVDQIANSGSVTATDDPQNLTDQFVGSDDQTIIQSPAGGNENPVAQNINGILNRIQQTLDQFVDSFLHLLSAPISHIMQLISYGSQFMGVLGQMFTWLPQPVYDVIVAALVLVIVIGVIKLLF